MTAWWNDLNVWEQSGLVVAGAVVIHL